VASPADVLSYVPHALGFTPVESLVVMTLDGNRLGATLRVDLPAGSAGPGHAIAFAETVLSFLRGDTTADGVLVVLYTLEEPIRYAPPPRADLVDVLGEVLGVAGLPVRSGWLVSGTTWRDYSCVDEHCCPWPGRPLDTVADSQLNAEMILGGSSFETSAAAAVLRSAPDVARPGTPSTSYLDAEEVEEAQAHFAAACAGHWDERAQFEATSRFWDAVIAGEDDAGRKDRTVGRRSGAEGSPFDTMFDGTSGGRRSTVLDVESAAFLLASIESRTVRDFLLVSACLGSKAALEGIRAENILQSDSEHAGALSGGEAPFVLPSVADGWGDSARPPAVESDASGHGDTVQAARSVRPVEAHPRPVDPATGRLFTEVLAGLHRGPVDWARVDLVTGLLVRLVSLAGPSGEARAAALTMLGWFEYARGRGSRAAVYFDAAEEALPGYRLARLLTELLNRGGLPEWARQRSTAWRPTVAPYGSRAA
jgi:hypothetical protein